jgi:2,3-bisphosphoglycerate-dependent phosphoglycerate mutase
MAKLVLIRHGESQWNLENRFTGWIDIGLTEKGKLDAYEAGKLLKHIPFVRAYTSILIRAVETTTEVLRGAEQESIPVIQDKALNERMYGDLQGLNKAECAAKWGDQQIHIWRRSYDVPPPNGESLADTAARALPYFEKEILPRLTKEGENILVSAHGNSLRAIVMSLDKLTKEEVLQLNIPNAIPIIYEVDPNGDVRDKKVIMDQADLEKMTP